MELRIKFIYETLNSKFLILNSSFLFMSSFDKKAIALHKKHQGKVAVCPKVPLKTKDDLSTSYTPGVAAVCKEIARNREKSWQLTNRANSVAIVTDGSAILGLGDIGPEAGMPVMEGKAVIFKEFAGVDAYPLAINTQDTEVIINFCKLIEPSFGGINLEDIAAPRCFTILERLEKELSIPVFHDDQDGSAIVVLSALINACRVTGQVLKEFKIVINGAGAAGIATARLLISEGVNNIFLLDSQGLVYSGRAKLNPYKKEISKRTNKKRQKGTLKDAIKDADVFIGLSRPRTLTKEMVRSMNKGSIILAMANPDPEIMPQEAKTAGAAIVGTGRSDFTNQVNNALVFPGLFRGLLDNRFRKVNSGIKRAVALAIAYTLKKPTHNKILPSINDKNIVKAIANAVKAKTK